MKLTKTLFCVLLSFLYSTSFSQDNVEDSDTTHATTDIINVSDNTSSDSLISSNHNTIADVEIKKTAQVSTLIKSDACNSKSYLDVCRNKINDDHFTDIKGFLIERKNEKTVEHSFTFTAGTSYEYYFMGSQDGQQQVIAKLLDATKKKVVATNQIDNDLHKITFDCKKTDVYYIQFTFLDNKEYCGAGVLGFTKKQQEIKKKK